MALADLLVGSKNPTVRCETEADWYGYWNSHVSVFADPAQRALVGGMVADRLAWVFLSGYQGALAHCFPEFAGSGWGCFAVAEAEDSPCEVSGDNPATLKGTKTWIAGAAHVDRLVVAVPPYMNGEHLGLFLGIANELGVPVVGLVDASVAATRRHYEGAVPVHVDLGLHVAMLSRLAQHGQAVPLVGRFAERTAIDNNSRVRSQHKIAVARDSCLGLGNGQAHHHVARRLHHHPILDLARSRQRQRGADGLARRSGRPCS